MSTDNSPEQRTKLIRAVNDIVRNDNPSSESIEIVADAFYGKGQSLGRPEDEAGGGSTPARSQPLTNATIKLQTYISHEQNSGGNVPPVLLEVLNILSGIFPAPSQPLTDTLLVFDEYCDSANATNKCPHLMGTSINPQCEKFDMEWLSIRLGTPRRCAACKDPITGYPNGLALVGRKNAT